MYVFRDRDKATGDSGGHADLVSARGVQTVFPLAAATEFAFVRPSCFCEFPSLAH